MSGISLVQPDVTLLLDVKGVIQKVELSEAIPEDGVEAWLGRPWVEIVDGSASDTVRRMVEDARTGGVSGFRQVVQRFPSGRELSLEYATVRLGGKAGLLAIGKNLQAVTELQTNLVAAQRAMERDYWKLRDIETRYRLLFDAASEAVLLVRGSDLRVIEANPAAVRVLGRVPSGRDLPGELAASDREPFRAMLQQVREHGKAPGMVARLGRSREPWLVRASLMASEPGPAFLVQLSPASAPLMDDPVGDLVQMDEIFERLPDACVVIEPGGSILRANRAFCDLVQVSAGSLVYGESLDRWLTRPGVDMAVLLSNVRRHGSVRFLATSVRGELGSEVEVEISAAGNAERDPGQIGVLLRRTPATRTSDVLAQRAEAALLKPLAGTAGSTSLRDLVAGTVAAVERHYITAALELTAGNRSAAAELLGLSRQGLYAKLDRHDLDLEEDGGTNARD